MAYLLVLHTEPQTGYYSGARPSDAPDLAWPRLAAVGEIRQELRIAGGETPSLSVSIDTADGARTADIAGAVRRVAILYRDGEPAFIGRVARITLGAVATLDIEAGS